MSTRNENSSPQEIRIRTLPNHVAHREPRGGGMDEMKLSGQGTREASLQ